MGSSISSAESPCQNESSDEVSTSTDISSEGFYSVMRQLESNYWEQRVVELKNETIRLQHSVDESRESFLVSHNVAVQDNIQSDALKYGADKIYNILQQLQTGSSIKEISSGIDDNVILHPTKMNVLERALVVDDLRPLPVPPPSPPPDTLMSDLLPSHYSSAMAAAVLKPITLPAVKPIPLDVSRSLSSKYPSTPSIGITDDDYNMMLAADVINIPQIIGRDAVLKLSKVFPEILSRSGIRCPGINKSINTLSHWIIARLGGDHNIPHIDMLTSFAQLALKHSKVKIDPQAADIWMECMFVAIMKAIPPQNKSPEISIVHGALQQLFHLLARGLVNDI